MIESKHVYLEFGTYIYRLFWKKIKIKKRLKLEIITKLIYLLFEIFCKLML